jgi:membrane fusion protein (multidrug efflux system)
MQNPAQEMNTPTEGTPRATTGVPPKPDGDFEELPVPNALMRKVKIFVPLALVLTVIAFVSYRYYIDSRDYISTDDAYVDGNRVSISSKILGRIVSLAVAEGDTVRQGQVVIRLDDTDLRAQHAQAASALALAKETIHLAQVTLDKAQTDFQRTSVQFKETIVPKEQFDHAQAELDAAKARLAIAHAQVATSQAQVGIIEAQLLNTTIAAPMTGVVAKRWLLEGDIAQPGQAIYSVYDLQHIWVTANYEETKLGTIAFGDSVDISVDSYPDVKFHGTVIQKGTFTASQFSLIPANNASGNFTKITQRVPIKISIEQQAVSSQQPRLDLLMGMSVEVKIKVRK